MPPGEILFGQSHNQVFKIGIDSESTPFVLPLIGSLAPHQISMPFEHRFWLENPCDLLKLLGRLVGATFEFTD